MKKYLLILALLATACGFACAQDTPEKPWQYVDAQDLTIINKGFSDTERDYWRLPACLKDSVREALWDLQKCSAGLAVRFATNSSRVGVKYQLLNNFHMPHMADTGIKGTDLYVFDETQAVPSWMYVNTNRPNPNDEKVCEWTYLTNTDGEMHEYMIYLPLYDGVEQLWVKVDSDAVITPAQKHIMDSNNRIVAYGTSIMQGGCASRTGMTSSNVISRALDMEVVNLGFSGNGKMDMCMARAMAEIPGATMYIIDPVPNCTEQMCDTLTYDFVNTLRSLRPDATIVMVEGLIYPYAKYDSYFGDYLPKKNEAFHRNYEKLKAENPDNLYYMTCEDMIGVEDDGTVDGVHLTDLGYYYYCNKILPILRYAISHKASLPPCNQ